MSQLEKRLSPNLRLEWKLLNQEKASSIEFLGLCEKMIEVGEFLLAHGVAKAGLAKHKKDRKLSQRAAHALSKAGSPMMATKILEELVAGGDRGVETHSLLASAYKDLWEYSTDLQSKKKYGELAIARYEEAYSTNSFDNLRTSQQQDLETQYYPCINIAFMHFMSGDLEKGRESAEKARQICEKLKERGTYHYWIQVTEAEAHLLLGSIDEAARVYMDAASSKEAQTSRIASTRKQALQIAGVYEDAEVREKISLAFPKLGIVACSGHLIDGPGDSRRFPPEAEAEAKRKIEEALEEMDANCGYSSAACGTDILFLETMAERGGETHVFLPFAKQEFIETSVRRSDGNWVDRFEKVLDQATSVHYVTREGYNGEDSLFSFCNEIMLGFTAMRGRGLDETPKLLTFWDGQRGSTGGTGELVDRWRANFNEPVVICANEVLSSLAGAGSSSSSTDEASPSFTRSQGQGGEAGFPGGQGHDFCRRRGVQQGARGSHSRLRGKVSRGRIGHDRVSFQATRLRQYLGGQFLCRLRRLGRCPQPGHAVEGLFFQGGLERAGSQGWAGGQDIHACRSGIRGVRPHPPEKKLLRPARQPGRPYRAYRTARFRLRFRDHGGASFLRSR